MIVSNLMLIKAAFPSTARTVWFKFKFRIGNYHHDDDCDTNAKTINKLSSVVVVHCLHKIQNKKNEFGLENQLTMMIKL